MTHLFSRLGQQTWRSPLAFAAVWIPSLTIFIVSFDPSLTSDMPVHLRTVFWAIHVALLLPLLMVIQSVLDDALATVRLHPFLMFTLAACCASVVFAPLSLALDVLFAPTPDLGPDPALARLVWDELTALLMPTLCIWLLVNGARLQLLSVPVMVSDTQDARAVGTADSGRKKIEEGGTVQTAIARAFWSKVPRNLGRDVLSLSAEQHYLHVTTTQGQSLILFPIGRAIEALADRRGLQIHRSHWVAVSHIVDVERSGNSVAVVLSNSQRLPVSRRNRPKLKEILETARPE